MNVVAGFPDVLRTAADGSAFARLRPAQFDDRPKDDGSHQPESPVPAPETSP